MQSQDEKQDSVQSSAYNPFPEPQTIPSGWDTSGFFSVNPSASIVQVEEPVESTEN